MNKEEIKNDINKLIDEIVDILENEEDLIEFKKSLEQSLVGIKYAKQLTEMIKSNIIDNINGDEKR